MTDPTVRILEILRIVVPIVIFSVMLFSLVWVVEVPLVLAVSVACLSAIIAFTVISKILSIQRKNQ